MEFEWKIFPGFTTVGIFNQIQQMMGELQYEPQNFTGRLIFMSMFNDIVWDAIGNDELCVKLFFLKKLSSMLKDSFAVIGLSQGLDLTRSGNLRLQTR